MRYDNIERIQLIQLRILEEVDRICKLLNIEYFLIGGTALGAVRHRGFIPWDDDIDIGMTRSHYENFLKYAQKELSKEYFLQTPRTDPHTLFFYAKVRKNRTVFAQWNEAKTRMHKGIYIDVFPFDCIPDDTRSRLLQFYKVQVLNVIFTIKQSPLPTKKRSGLVGALHKLRWICARLLLKPIPLSFIISCLDRAMKRFNNSNGKYLASLLFPRYLTECISRDDLYPLSLTEFCKKSYPCPNNIAVYLETHYGDYMKLPPERERVNHRPHILDLGELS